MAGALNIQTGPPRQRYYPQCTGCMQKQATAIRNDKACGGRAVGAVVGSCILTALASSSC